jgi:hypothetical protein
MSNSQEIIIRVVVDVDRNSKLYSHQAVQVLDPTKKGPGGNETQTTKEADLLISKMVALSACQRLLVSSLPEEFGSTTLRMHSPKNVKEFTEEVSKPEEVDRYLFDKT